MERALALAAGIAAWGGVAALAILIAFNMKEDSQQVLWFLPILGAVVIAWAIGEWVTQRVFMDNERGE